jgi:histidinol-phosphate aminotransferase
MGHADLIQGLDRVKNSFNSYPLDRLALVGATAAIEDQPYFEKTRDAVLRTRSVMTEGLSRLGFEVIPSAANFIFAKHPARDGMSLAAALREKNIIVRHFKTQRIDQYLRITVGTDDDCSKLLDACKSILS